MGAVDKFQVSRFNVQIPAQEHSHQTAAGNKAILMLLEAEASCAFYFRWGENSFASAQISS